MQAKQRAAEDALHDQMQLLPQRQLIFVCSIMSLALLVCFIDQNGIGVLLPSIARDLDARASISWAGTSALIANTVFQVLYGRLSDLFGRKVIFLAALILLSLSDLACGLSVNASMLYVFRGLAGVANGGIGSVAMMIMSDVVTLKERGKYQGILGCMVGMGNAIGPLIASAFAIHLTWRGLFYLLSPLIMVSVGASWRYLPSNMPKLNYRQTIAKIDVLGMVTGTAAIILLLIPISDGGHSGMPWSSPVVIAMFTLGGVFLVAFLLIEWKHAELPMLPLGMFKIPSVAAMLAQTFLLGMAYYSLTYFLPLYWQNVRGMSPLMSAVLVLPLVVTQSISSTCAGLAMSYLNRYVESIWLGFGLWTLGGGLLILADESLHIGFIALFLIIIGMGTGCTFQPVLVALQAHLPKSQRAVVVSSRNFLRCGGGAVGLAVSTAVLSAVLRSSLPPELKGISNSSFAIPNLDHFDSDQRAIIKHAYASASRGVFIYMVPLTGISFFLTIFIRDRGLEREEERKANDTKPDPTGLGRSSSPPKDLEMGERGERDSENLTSGARTAPDETSQAIVTACATGLHGPAPIEVPDESSRKPSMASKTTDDNESVV